MSLEATLFLALGAAAGGFVNGLAGTGTALFALGFYLVVLDPIRAVAVVASLSVLVGLQGLWLVRKDILGKPRRTLRFLIPGILGVPLGLSLLKVIDASALRIGIAAFLVIYGLYFGFRKKLPSFSRRTPTIDAGVGLVGGVLGGAAAVSGALPQMWLSLRPWTKSETRAVLQPFNSAILSTTVILLLFSGAFDTLALSALLITVPVGLIFAQIGIGVFRRISDESFRRLLIILTLLIGAGILVSEAA